MPSRDACRAFLDQWDEISQDEDPAIALAHAEEGMRRVRRLGDPPDLYARALVLLGSSYRRLDPERAVETILEALRMYRDKIDERADQADAERRLGIALGDLPTPDYDGALFALDAAYVHV